jgi:sterol desaturase/sphingolipid hydroxylase (fatty acid hydroxylase superfamily)
MPIWMSASIGLFVGALSFTFVEYVLHRWGGHGSLRGVWGHSVKKHLEHHATPTYFPRTHQKLGAVLVLLPCVALGLVLGWAAGVAMFVGLAGGLGLYEFVHMNMHNRLTPPRTPYGWWVSRLHLHHHFEDAHTNHGITSPLWDFLLGTYRKPGLVRVPDRPGVAPRWILEHADDPRLEGRFAVRRRASRRRPADERPAPAPAAA